MDAPLNYVEAADRVFECLRGINRIPIEQKDRHLLSPNPDICRAHINLLRAYCAEIMEKSLDLLRELDEQEGIDD